MDKRKTQGGKKGIWIVFIVIIISCLMLEMIKMADAQPVGPDTLNVVSTSRREVTPASTVQALAGNVTELFINATMTTRSWQGYYGNVSGTITLDDANNNTMYSWDLAAPQGEIYAARSTIDFSTGNIMCANTTTVQEEENNLSIGSSDKDGVDETFSYTTHPEFYVGMNYFQEDECNYTMSPYVNDKPDSARRFNETLLYDKSHDEIVYTALINPNSEGFKVGGEYYDFEMLVGEDGHTDSLPTTYYFYVELE